MSSSLTNQIIANIKKTSTNFNATSFINTQNVVCIDTCNNRIGINRKNPRYSIDISGDTSLNAVSSYNLYITNLAKIHEISANKIAFTDLSVITLDVSAATYKSLIGESIDTSFINITDLSIGYISVPTISCGYLDVSGDICCNGNISSVDLSVVNLHVTGSTILPSQDIINLTVSNLGTIKYIWTDDISAKFIRVDEISCNNNLYVNNKSSIHDGSFNYLNVDFDTSLNSLYAKDAVILEISANKLVIDELSANTIDVSNIISGGITVISGGTIGDPNFPQDAVFDNLVAKKLDISRVHITEYLDNSGLTDLSDGRLVLPFHRTEYDTTNPLNLEGMITFDTTNQQVKFFGNNTWKSIKFGNNTATVKLNRAVPGNKVSYNTASQTFEIESSNNLLLNNTDLSYIKYIPMTFDVSLGEKFDISDNDGGNLFNTLNINTLGTNDNFEIHAHVGVKFLNRYPGDVELNNYVFSMCPDLKNDSTDKNRVSFDNSYVSFANTVIVFDNSFNNGHSSLSYIGPLVQERTIIGTNNSSQVQEEYWNGFNFYISSLKQIEYLSVDEFVCTIKQIQN